ncbi:hypothetical protein N0V82_010524 [Gnomoniopsis sp. IMI 355080]|nr:hypothetical protein N0V82_010524 [Gnomoniopsis sp. IMI 355080]
MEKYTEIILVVGTLVFCTGLTVGLTYAPCYSSLCTEEFFPYETRLHLAAYFALLASIGCALLLRASSPQCRRASETHLTRKQVPLLDHHITVGGLALGVWIVGITIATTGYWVGPESAFWQAKAKPLAWSEAHLRILITGVIGHHADILLGLLLIPVGRNSILGRVFDLHYSTLLYAHKLIAYLLLVAVFAHGAAYYTFVAAYAAAPDGSPRKAAYNIDNPAFTMAETRQRGPYVSATLGTGTISFLFILVIVITALPTLRRRSYNTFYYLHIILSSLIFIAACIHASTDFYFLLPGLILWILDWVWRIFRGDTGLGKTVPAILEDAGHGWYRITLKPSRSEESPAKQLATSSTCTVDEKQLIMQPIQSFYLNIPRVSRVQNHAFTAAKTATHDTGPVFLLQRASLAGRRKSSKSEQREWTWKLSRLVESQQDARQAGKLVPCDILCRVEGPYIPSGPAAYEVAARVVCLVGGTGLTGAYSLAMWWSRWRARDIGSHFTLVWTVRDRDTAVHLREWLVLVGIVEGIPNMTLKLHVSSECGRIDPGQELRRALVASSSSSSFEEEESEVTSKENKREASAWAYVSGPAGLLAAAEDACLALKQAVTRGQAGGELAVSRLDYYLAKWET